VLLDRYTPDAAVLTDAVVLDDVVAVASPPVQAALAAALDGLELGVSHIRLGGDGDLVRWREALRVLQGSEAWATHGAWLREADPPLSAAVRARFEAGSRVTAEEIAAASLVRVDLRARLTELLDPTTALVVPAAATEAIPADAGDDILETARQATLQATCLASLTGLPSISLPMAGLPLPIGLALIAQPDGDEALLLFGQKPVLCTGF
jgi:amidase